MTNNSSTFSRLLYGIGPRIIIPFLLLTLIIAGAGTFLLTTFITDSLNERLTNRLVDAGRVVSERLVNFEEDRLETLRVISATEGVAQNLAGGDAEAVADLALPFVISANAVARVTFYDKNGVVIDTTLSSGDDIPAINIPQNSETLALIHAQLQLNPEKYSIVRATATEEAPIADVTVLGQEYSLAYGDWRLRDQSFGLFSVALPF